MLRQLYSLKAAFHTSVISILLLGNTVVEASTCEPSPPFELLNSKEGDAVNRQSIQPFLTDTHTPVLINFWAIWCAPCRTELPLLQQLSIDTGISVQLVNAGDDKTKIEALLTELGVTKLSSQIADSNVFSKFGFIGLPASIVVTDEAIYVGLGKLKEEEKLTQWLNCLQSEQLAP